MKKAITVLLTLCLIVVGLEACGSDSVKSNENISNSEAADEENVVLDNSNFSQDNISEEDKSGEKAESVVESEEYYDSFFLLNLSKALQTRWDLANNDDELDVDDGTEFETILDEYETGVNAEIEILGDIRDKKFEDFNLQEYAISYTNGLNQQKKAIESAKNKEIDEESFYEQWEDASDKRYEQIYQVYTNYDLSIDSKYIYNLNSIFNTVYLNRYGKELFWEKMNDGTFFDNMIVEQSSEGLDILKITPTNPTDYEFKDLDMYLKIIDLKGTEDTNDDELIEILRYTVGSWKPGEETQLVFKREKESNEEDAYLILDFA